MSHIPFAMKNVLIVSGCLVATWIGVMLTTEGKQRVYPGNIVYESTYGSGIAGDYQRIDRFIEEYSVSLNIIQRTPTYEEMVDCLLTFEYDDRCYAFGVLLMTGFFEKPQDAISFCNLTLIKFRDLLWNKHLNSYNLSGYPRPSWCELHPQRFMTSLRELFYHGMQKGLIWYYSVLYGKCNVYVSSSLTFPTSVIFTQHKQHDSVFLYNYLLSI
jgi:hypothetical protein